MNWWVHSAWEQGGPVELISWIFWVLFAITLHELAHGDSVVLDAEITRGNEMSNTIGIQYGGYILTGIPAEGSIVRFKPNLFLNCRIHGQVIREGDSKRPKILVDKMEQNEIIEQNNDLFNDYI